MCLTDSQTYYANLDDAQDAVNNFLPYSCVYNIWPGIKVAYAGEFGQK